MAILNISKYFIEGAVQAFNYAIAPLSAFSTMTQLNGAQLNQYVQLPNIRLASTASSTFTHAAGYSGDNSDGVAVNVQLSNWNYQIFDWTDSMAATLSPDTLRKQGASLGNRLAYDVVKNILSTTSSFSNSNVSSGSAYTSTSTITALGATVDNAYWPQADRSLIVGPDLFWKLAANTTQINRANYIDPAIVSTGFLPDYFGFKVYKTHAIPSTVKGVAATSRALAVAFSLPTPQDSNVETVVPLQNQDGSGLPLQIKSWREPGKAKTVYVLETLSGVTLIDSTAAYNLTVTNINV